MAKESKAPVIEGAQDVKKITFRSVFYIVAPFLSIILLVVLWFLASASNGSLVPSPLKVWDRFVELAFTKFSAKVSLFGHIWASLQRVLIALGISVVTGITFGVMVGWSKSFRAIFGTLFELLRPIPPIAWLSLSVMWFGIGEFPKVFIVFIGTFTPLVINSYTGIRLVDPLLLDVGRMFNAKNNQLLMEIAVPSALPAIFAGFRNATSSGWMVVLAAEMIVAKTGLGFLIYRGMDYFDVPQILVGMITIGIVGALLAVITNYLERWICPWNVKLEQE